MSDIVGIFYDHDGRILLHFARMLWHIHLSMYRLGILITVVSQWANSSSFILESDNLNTVSWFSTPSSSPWKFKNIIGE